MFMPLSAQTLLSKAWHSSAMEKLIRFKKKALREGESLSLYRREHLQMYRGLLNVVAHLVVYQLH